MKADVRMSSFGNKKKIQGSRRIRNRILKQFLEKKNYVEESKPIYLNGLKRACLLV